MKIGVVGPAVSVERILKISNGMEKDLDFVPFTYDIATEVKDIIKRNPMIDFWLFSGIFPYTIAEMTDVRAERMDYVYQSANDMYVEILRFILQTKKIPEHVSIDLFMDGEEFTSALNENAFLHNIQFHNIPYSGETSIEEIYEHHLQLWQQSRVELVITYYAAVEKMLKDKGIPVYLIGPNKTNIYYSLKIIIEKIKTKYYQGSQTTAVKFKIKDFDKLKVVKSAGYAYEFLQLDLKRLILQCCQRLEGFLVESTPGQFVIFTTRGIAERNIALIESTVKFLHNETGNTVLAGIGHATTVFTAEQFASRAIEHIDHLDENMIALMRDDGSVVERYGSIREIEYSTVHHNLEIAKKLEQTTVSVKTYTRILAIVQHRAVKHFTAKEIAQELEMTERNAQRILSELLKGDIISVDGEVQRNKRGRSTKVYKLNE